MNANARSATSTIPRHLGKLLSVQCLTSAVSLGCSSLNPVGNMKAMRGRAANDKEPSIHSTVERNSAIVLSGRMPRIYLHNAL